MTERSTPSDPDAGQPKSYDDTAPPDEGLAPLPQDRPPAKPGKKQKDASIENLGRPTPQVAPPQVPSVGRAVHFLIPKGMTNRDEPVHRAATISKVYESPKDKKLGKVDLHVMVCREDYPDNFHPGPLLYVQGASFDADAEACGTWHWPERV